MSEKFLNTFIIVTWLTAAPIVVYLIMGEPVGLLKIAGAIEAAHIPVVTAMILYLNLRWLPPDLRPSRVTTLVTAVSGLFFAGFAGVYVYQLIGN